MPEPIQLDAKTEALENFQAPGTEHFPAVYWFWHHVPSKAEITEQIEGMAAAGYKTFFIQARLSFPIEEFLNEDYLRAYHESMEVAKRLGLTAVLYDDYNWVSGHGGGQTVQEHDHLRERSLFWTSANLQDRRAQCSISSIRSMMVQGLGKAGLNWCYEGSRIIWGKWIIFNALAYEEGVTDFGKVHDVTQYCVLEESSENGCQVTLELPDSFPPNLRVTVFVEGRCTSSRLINYLLPEAGERFAEVAYEPFRKVLGKYLGDPLKLSFFDHPYAGFYTWDEIEGNLRNNLMFDEAFVQAFEREHQYPVEKALLSFVIPTLDDTPRYRCDFLETYSQMGQESFFGPLARWTQKNGIQLSGHELLSFIGGWGFVGGFSDIDHRCNFGADYFGVDRYRAITGVDAFNNQPQLSTKMGASLAKAHGRRGCIVEQYYVSVDMENTPAFAGQWDLTLTDMRAQAIRHTLFGARQFIYHGYYLTDGEDDDYTQLSNARWDFPPGLNYEPWFSYHGDFAVELARLSSFIYSGEPRNEFAVFYPLRTMWAEGPTHLFGPESAFWNRWLAEHAYGYDIIDETELRAGQVVGSVFEVSGRRYSTIILPGVTTLQSQKTVDRLEEFVSAGGTLIASGTLPSASQEKGHDANLGERISALFDDAPMTLYLPGPAESPGFQATINQFVEGNFPEVTKVKSLDSELSSLWMWTGADQADQLIAVFNDSDDRHRVTLEIPAGKFVPQLWDLQSGERFTWAWFDWKDTSTLVNLDLLPQQLICLRAIPAPPDLPRLLTSSLQVVEAAMDEKERLSVTIMSDAGSSADIDLYSHTQPAIVGEQGNHSLQELEDNYWRFTMELPALPTPIVLSQGWSFRAQGQTQMSPIDIRLGWEQQSYPDYSGVGYYQNQFSLPDDYQACKWELVFDQVETALEVYLNGEWVGARGWSPYNLVLPQLLLKKGDNQLEIRVSNTAGNRYYYNTPFAGEKPTPSGLIGAPQINPVSMIQVTT